MLTSILNITTKVNERKISVLWEVKSNMITINHWGRKSIYNFITTFLIHLWLLHWYSNKNWDAQVAKSEKKHDTFSSNTKIFLVIIVIFKSGNIKGKNESSYTFLT
jgi:hypothetical protein